MGAQIWIVLCEAGGRGRGKPQNSLHFRNGAASRNGASSLHSYWLRKPSKDCTAAIWQGFPASGTPLVAHTASAAAKASCCALLHVQCEWRTSADCLLGASPRHIVLEVNRVPLGTASSFADAPEERPHQHPQICSRRGKQKPQGSRAPRGTRLRSFCLLRATSLPRIFVRNLPAARISASRRASGARPRLHSCLKAARRGLCSGEPARSQR